MTWNFDMGAAPRGQTETITRTIGKNTVEVQEHIAPHIIVAGSGGVVTTSRWVPKEGRWSMFTKAVPPIAWQPWPSHPETEA